MEERSRPLIVAMKGHPGTGKSTLARSIAAALHCPLLDKDDVRDATLPLELHHRVPTPLLNDLSYAVLWRLADAQLRLGLSLVIDSPLSRRPHLDRLLDLARSAGARLLVVECFAGDEAEWKRRIEGRAGDSWHKPRSWEELEKLVNGYGGCTDYDMTGDEVERIVIDTTAGGDAAVAAVISFISSVAAPFKKKMDVSACSEEAIDACKHVGNISIVGYLAAQSLPLLLLLLLLSNPLSLSLSHYSILSIFAKISETSVMAMNSYAFQAELLLRDYLLADPYVRYTSVFFGILMCKMAYELTQLISSLYFKGYTSLTKIQRIEWNNRGMSNAHAIFIASMSIYLVFFSDLYSDHLPGLVTFRSSSLSTFALGVSIGYFICDIAMILWLYPSLGGMEYIIHHLLSLTAVSYAMLSGEGQLFTYMVLMSETTTPSINLRWFLDTAGMKRSKAYLVNGIGMFVTWLVARILLFVYLFYQIYLHYDQIKKMHTFGCILVFVAPLALSIMNMMWFTKILRGLKRTLAKRQ
ncbi:hypothetical protein J5N97_008661 [Dioscorea zingiberensis]|uniref:TLC domain-containing protein n=1 Tax=Dioscorea zingiberensis TaxID=325984 RepID=A0A9D5CVD3_9LILI|nr:hypothetical protein J5N97_008661 [Dioscorea zingiberensis]